MAWLQSRWLLVPGRLHTDPKMDKEESMASLLSDSDGEEVTVFKKFGGTSSRNQISFKQIQKNKVVRNNKSCLLKSALFLSFTLNIVFFVALVLNQNSDGVRNMAGVPSTDVACTSSPSSSSSFESNTNSSVNSAIQTNETQEAIEPQQQQSQQQQQEPAATPCSPILSSIPHCGADSVNDGEDSAKGKDSQKNEKNYVNIFADLTQNEIKAASNYLRKDKTLNAGPFRSNKCRVMSMELHTPNKTKAIMFMDSYADQPPREAQVMISCEHSRPPVIKEIILGPLPKIKYHKENPRRVKSDISFSFATTYGIGEAYTLVTKELFENPDLQTIISESYGVTVSQSCSEKCLTYLPVKTSSAYNDHVIITITTYYSTEFTTINPLDLIFVTKEMIPNSKVFVLTHVFYGGQTFESLPKLVQAYKSGTVNKTRMTFPRPEPGQDSIPGSTNLRGSIFPSEPKAGPKSFEPDGKRYRVKDQHVNYMEWSFNTRLSVASGPQLWDVRWGGKRIAYEISLQDVGVIYAGANPTSFYSHLSDSAFGLGNHAHGLLPGLDCPEGATFLSTTVTTFVGSPSSLPHSQCIFEHNTERPLRRHRNGDGANGHNHSGLVDRVLIVRTIIVEYNYDYIFDMIFHQNGALELKTYATGYVMSQHYYNGEKPFGFKIHSESVGSIHHHIFNYKIDLDIMGTSNRYESLDLVVDEHSWPWYHKNKDTFQQLSFQHNLRKTEQDGVLRYNYSQPRYHIVYNDEIKNAYNNHKAYRIATKGFSKQVLPDDSPVLKSRRWSKYEMLVTQRKDAEETSSSIFSMFDGANPHVDIDRYLEDNETIIDEDLVFWITVGMHHIPHTEDIPNTPTVGTEAAILLTPFNYFHECPSVGSRDSIRVDKKDNGVERKDYGIDWSKRCLPAQYDYEKLFPPTSNFTI